MIYNIRYVTIGIKLGTHWLRVFTKLLAHPNSLFYLDERHVIRYSNLSKYRSSFSAMAIGFLTVRTLRVAVIAYFDSLKIMIHKKAIRHKQQANRNRERCLQWDFKVNLSFKPLAKRWAKHIVWGENIKFHENLRLPKKIKGV